VGERPPSPARVRRPGATSGTICGIWSVGTTWPLLTCFGLRDRTLWPPTIPVGSEGGGRAAEAGERGRLPGGVMLLVLRPSVAPRPVLLPSSVPADSMVRLRPSGVWWPLKPPPGAVSGGGVGLRPAA